MKQMCKKALWKKKYNSLINYKTKIMNIKCKLQNCNCLSISNKIYIKSHSKLKTKINNHKR